MVALVAMTAGLLSAQDGAEIQPKTIERVFHVSKIGNDPAKREMFRKLWDSLQILNPETGGPPVEIRIHQALGKRGDQHLYIALRKATRIAVMLNDGGLLEDVMVAVHLEPDGVHDGTTALGAATRVEKFREVSIRPNPDAPSKEDFLSRIKTGEKFSTLHLAERSCRPCLGDGKLGTLQGGRDCEACHGTGHTIQRWTLQW